MVGIRSFVLGGSLLATGELCGIAFTPWTLADYPGHMAPAVLVLAMDLLLKGGGNTLEGGLVLAMTYGVMLLFVMTMALRRSKSERQLNALEPGE